MSVIGIAVETQDSPQATLEYGKASFVRKFKVEVSSQADGPIVAIGALGIPKKGEIYVFGNEFHPYSRCRTVTAERLEPNSTIWLVIAQYSTPELARHDGSSPGGGKGGTTSRDTPGEEENPTLALPEIEMRTEVYQTTVYNALNTDVPPKRIACQSSAGEVFVPAPTKDTARIVLTIARNEDIGTDIAGNIQTYGNTLNAEIFFGFGVKQVKFQGIDARKETKQLSSNLQFSYLRVTYTFHIRYGTDVWSLRLLDQGTYFVQPIPLLAEHKPFLDDNQLPRTGLLDGSGHAATGTDLTDGVFLDFTIYDAVDWSPLNLPADFTEVS